MIDTKRYACIRVEINQISVRYVDVDSGSTNLVGAEFPCVRPTDYRSDADLFVIDLVRAANVTLARCPQGPAVDAIVVSTPGAIRSDRRSVVRASRLGIFSEVLLAEAIERSTGVPALILNDADCIATYEHRSLSQAPQSHLIVLAGYGIGSSLILNNTYYRGAGHAGHLGRIPVTPFWAGGPLTDLSYSVEGFSSRIAVSKSLRRFFEAERHLSHTLPSEVRNLRERILNYRHASLVPLDEVERLIQLGDTSTARVVDDAARFVGIAIAGAVIHINPEVMTFSGDLFDNLPSYWEGTKYYSRQYSWPNAYDAVRFRRGEIGSDAQYRGCGILASSISS